MMTTMDVLSGRDFGPSCRLMGKVASDKCHKWVFKESSECEPNISNYWQSSFDAVCTTIISLFFLFLQSLPPSSLCWLSICFGGLCSPDSSVSCLLATSMHDTVITSLLQQAAPPSLLINLPVLSLSWRTYVLMGGWATGEMGMVYCRGVVGCELRQIKDDKG
jgi:hypothetical protein